MMHRFGFVLEQTLGHVAHSRNVERALAAERDIDASVIHIDFTEPSGWQRLPGLRTWSWRASIAARNALRGLVQEKKSLDGIFIHTQVASLLAGEIMRSVPTVVSLDATPLLFDREADAYGHRRNTEPIELLKKQANARAFAAAQRLVTWSQWAAYSLVRDYGVPQTKIDVIPPGVDLTQFRPTLLPKPAGPMRVLFVGGQFERKGGPELVAAAGLLGEKVQVDLVTPDPIDVPAGLNLRVHRNLKPQSDDLVSLYRKADVFVLPSRGDCMPQAVTEALACGLPVVATRVGAIPEMVRDGVNGFLVPTRNPRELAAAIDSIAQSPRRRHEMGRWSRLLAQQEYDAARNNRRIFALMRSLAAVRPLESERSA